MIPLSPKEVYQFNTLFAFVVFEKCQVILLSDDNVFEHISNNISDNSSDGTQC